MNLTYEAIAGRIDHALLSPTMTGREMREGCRMADAYQVASVCIKPFAVALAAEVLANSTVKVGTVVGFPHGGQTRSNKVAEAKQAIEEGAAEIDMVVNIGQILGGDWAYVEDEIREVATEVRRHHGLLKVILETCYLDDPQKIRACEICGRIAVDYVKTSTGFGSAGANPSDLILMRKHSPESVKVKASGGIRNLETAIKFAELGAERLGLSRTAEILDDLRLRLGQPRVDVSRGTISSKARRDGDY